MRLWDGSGGLPSPTDVPSRGNQPGGRSASLRRTSGGSDSVFTFGLPDSIGHLFSGLNLRGVQRLTWRDYRPSHSSVGRPPHTFLGGLSSVHVTFLGSSVRVTFLGSSVPRLLFFTFLGRGMCTMHRYASLGCYVPGPARPGPSAKTIFPGSRDPGN